MTRREWCDAAEMRRALALLHEPGAVWEIRVLGVESGNGFAFEQFGYFDDIDRTVVAVKDIAARAEGVYATLNPIDPALLSRANNRLKRAGKGKATSDKHVTRRSWILFDLDPVRPAGISSTDEELALARRSAERVRSNLSARGWPEPVLACSGNGYHLLHRVDLPADDAGLVHRVLLQLAREFDTDRVKLDPSVANASRISKLYGTTARKGDPTPDRPHRLARIESTPTALVPVSLEQLELAAGTPPKRSVERWAVPPHSHSSPPWESGFGLEEWIAGSGLRAEGPTPWPGGGAGAQRWTLPICPWNPEHTDSSAFIVRLPNGAISAGCHHASCKDRGWQDLRAGHAPARGKTRVSSTEGGAAAAGIGAAVDSELPAFPENAFMGVIGEYADLIGTTTESPRAFQWAACATALSVIIGRRATLAWGPGSMPPTLYTCCVGPTARARKSTALSDVVDVLLVPLAGSDAGPLMVTVVDGSVSGEGIADALADGKDASRLVRRRAILLYNELAAVLAKIDRDQAGNLMEFLMAMFDARQRWSSRTRSKDAPSFDITEGTLVVLAASTQEWLVQSTREIHITSGFINRFLFVAGASDTSLSLRPSIPTEAAKRLQARVRDAVLGLAGTFALDRAAKEFHDQRYRAFQRSEDGLLLQQATGRQDAISLRVAMILAAAEGSLTVNLRHVEAGWAVTDHGKEAVRGLVARAGQSQRALVEDRIRRAGERLTQAGHSTFSQRDLYQRVKGTRGLDAEQFARMFRAMLTSGEFVEVASGTFRLP